MTIEEARQRLGSPKDYLYAAAAPLALQTARTAGAPMLSMNEYVNDIQTGRSGNNYITPAEGISMARSGITNRQNWWISGPKGEGGVPGINSMQMLYGPSLLAASRLSRPVKPKTFDEAYDDAHAEAYETPGKYLAYGALGAGAVAGGGLAIQRARQASGILQGNTIRPGDIKTFIEDNLSTLKDVKNESHFRTLDKALAEGRGKGRFSTLQFETIRKRLTDAAGEIYTDSAARFPDMIDSPQQVDAIADRFVDASSVVRRFESNALSDRKFINQPLDAKTLGKIKGLRSFKNTAQLAGLAAAAGALGGYGIYALRRNQQDIRGLDEIPEISKSAAYRYKSVLRRNTRIA